MSAEPRPVLVMGVCGVGKSTIAKGLAARLGRAFLEGDAFHTEENVAAMSAGRPLTDAMRAGWLDAIAAAAAGTGGAVISCSALKRSYRDRLRARLGEIDVIHLDGPRALLAERMAHREDHFMPVALLDSQFADLEPPSPGARCLRLDVGAPADELIERASGFVRREDAGAGARHTT